MLIFRKTQDSTNEFDTTTVTVESEAITLTEVLEDFKGFLMASGFPINFSDSLVIYKEDVE